MKKNKSERLAAKAAASSKIEKIAKPVTAAAEPVALKVKTKKAKTEPVTDTAKTKLNGKTAEEAVKKISEKKDLKYKYPADMDSLSKRKVFRAEVRRKLKAFEKSVNKLQDAINTRPLKEDKILLKKTYEEFDAYSKGVLAHPEKVA